MSFVVKQLLGADDVEEVLERFGVGDREAFARSVRSGQFMTDDVPQPAVRVGRDVYGWDPQEVVGWLIERGVGPEAHAVALVPTGGPKRPLMEKLDREGYVIVDERDGLGPGPNSGFGRGGS